MKLNFCTVYIPGQKLNECVFIKFPNWASVRRRKWFISLWVWKEKRVSPLSSCEFWMSLSGVAGIQVFLDVTLCRWVLPDFSKAVQSFETSENIPRQRHVPESLDTNIVWLQFGTQFKDRRGCWNAKKVQCGWHYFQDHSYLVQMEHNRRFMNVLSAPVLIKWKVACKYSGGR
jgi:hypothetical protein